MGQGPIRSIIVRIRADLIGLRHRKSFIQWCIGADGITVRTDDHFRRCAFFSTLEQSPHPMNRILSLLFIGMITIVPAAAQQLKPSGTETSRSLLENEQVSVKEMRLRPGAKIPPATYPNSFVYGLTDGSIVYTLPGKTPFEITFRAGEA